MSGVEVEVEHLAAPDPDSLHRAYNYCIVCRAAVHQESGVWVHSGTLKAAGPTP